MSVQDLFNETKKNTLMVLAYNEYDNITDNNIRTLVRNYMGPYGFSAADDTVNEEFLNLVSDALDRDDVLDLQILDVILHNAFHGTMKWNLHARLPGRDMVTLYEKGFFKIPPQWAGIYL